MRLANVENVFDLPKALGVLVILGVPGRVQPAPRRYRVPAHTPQQAYFVYSARQEMFNVFFFQHNQFIYMLLSEVAACILNRFVFTLEMNILCFMLLGQVQAEPRPYGGRG